MINSFQDLLLAIGSLVNLLLPLAVAIALFLFLWGLFSFIRESGNEEKIKEGKSKMIWGVVVLFVMTSIWGLVYFLQGALFGYYISGGNTGDPGFTINGDPCPIELQGTVECNYDISGNYVNNNSNASYQINPFQQSIPVKSR